METAVSLDWLDIKLLDHIQRNGHCSNVELSAAVGLSPSPCLARVKRLCEAGVIRGYDANIALEKLGNFITVFSEITISEHRRDSFRLFEEAAETLPEITECYNVSGGCDYILKIIVESMSRFSAIRDHMLELDVGIIKFSNRIVLRKPFETRTVPLRHLAPKR
ncbi:winged helix-turn-helix transcriptional regulator [Bosea sp. OK403]|uniref:Lrp/AsnC family transcriptional regulator n=1 Tax=Bosea sp. OK403 TaxID=1855286 RepID=UPI000B882109|nr:winged helix-turn-helix transcriptional regulator [Bosea sp. OK403]